MLRFDFGDFGFPNRVEPGECLDLDHLSKYRIHGFLQCFLELAQGNPQSQHRKLLLWGSDPYSVCNIVGAGKAKFKTRRGCWKPLIRWWFMVLWSCSRCPQIRSSVSEDNVGQRKTLGTEIGSKAGWFLSTPWLQMASDQGPWTTRRILCGTNPAQGNSGCAASWQRGDLLVGDSRELLL